MKNQRSHLTALSLFLWDVKEPTPLFKKSRGCRPWWCGQPSRVVGLGRDGTLHGTYESRSYLFPLGRHVSRKAGKKKIARIHLTGLVIVCSVKDCMWSSLAACLIFLRATTVREEGCQTWKKGKRSEKWIQSYDSLVSHLSSMATDTTHSTQLRPW